MLLAEATASPESEKRRYKWRRKMSAKADRYAFIREHNRRRWARALLNPRRERRLHLDLRSALATLDG